LSDDEKQQSQWRDLYECDPDGGLSADRETAPNELEVAYDPGGTPDFAGVTGDDPFIERRLEELMRREPKERRIAEQGDKWTLPETWRRYEERLYEEALRMDADRGR